MDAVEWPGAGRVAIGYLDNLDPTATVQRMLALHGEVDVLGIVAPDHPVVREEGMPVVALMVGTRRFLCQELCEMSFRSFLREQSDDRELLAPRRPLEDETFAYENTLDCSAVSPI